MINTLMALTTKELPILTVVYLIKQILTLILIFAPIILIIMAMIDLLKILISTENQKESTSKLIKRILYCMIIFFIPLIIDFVTSMFGYNFSSSNIWTESNKDTIAALKEIKSQERAAYEMASEADRLKYNDEKAKQIQRSKQELQNLIQSEEQSNKENASSSGGSTSDLSGGTRDQMVEYAKSFVGKLKYVYGGTSLVNGADCSGFVQQIYKKYGIDIPRVANDQSNAGEDVSIENLKKGDLLFYGSGNYATHVAMYIGDGQVVHASNERLGIRISNMNYRTIIKRRSYIND